MDDIRWFTPNRYCALPVPVLRAAGLRIALDGDAPARLAVAMDAPCAVDAYEFSLRHRCPFLLNVADLPPWRLEGGKPDFVFQLGGKVRRIPRPAGRFPERPGYYSRLRFVAARAARIWCPSENSVGDLAARFGLSADRVPFCYDSDRFNGKSGERSAGSGNVVLAISRLVPHKDHAVILRAAARLDPKPRVRIVGEGPEAGSLRALAQQLGVPLDLAGTWASDQEIVDAYLAADVVVSASRFEGFGLTPMEGLAMGLPVIASDIPPHREFLNDAVRYFTPGDEAALAGELSSVLTVPTVPTVRPVLTVPTVPTVRPVLTDLTIESCAARLLPRLRDLIGPRP